MDTLRTRLHNFKTERQNQILVSNSLIQALQNQLEHKRTAVKEKEEEKYHLEDKQKDVSKELSQVSLAIKNIYSRCVSMMNIATPMLLSSSATSSTKESSSTGTLAAGLSNKSLVTLAEKIESSILVIHTRTMDLIEITSEYKEITSDQGNDNSVASLSSIATDTKKETGMKSILSQPSTRS